MILDKGNYNMLNFTVQRNNISFPATTTIYRVYVVCDIRINHNYRVRGAPLHFTKTTKYVKDKVIKKGTGETRNNPMRSLFIPMIISPRINHYWLFPLGSEKLYRKPSTFRGSTFRYTTGELRLPNHLFVPRNRSFFII